MTRKDYVAIAKAFATLNERMVDPSDEWIVLRAEIGDVFEADNPLFDRGRFYRACEA